MDFKFQIGPEVIKTWARLDYTVWFALAEFVDNSVQAYLNHKHILDPVYEVNSTRLQVEISYDSNSGFLRIRDNSIGMTGEELERAMRPAVPPEYIGGLSEFGMGLKTAATWLGDEWKVRTKKLGESKEYEISFSVDEVAAGKVDLPLKEREQDPKLHYTIIEFPSIRKKIQSKTLTKTKTYLSSIYRLQTRNNVMNLFWGDEELIYDDNLNILTASDPEQTPYKKDFSFEIGGKRVYGWCAVLKSGGRPKAGFAVFRRGRIIYGQPTAWRPYSLYGQEQGSNDTVNQRLVGEIHLDDFTPSHTKNAILWEDDEEDLINEKLLSLFGDYRLKAKEKVGGAGSGPSTQTIDVAVDQLVATLSSPEFLDTVKYLPVPSREVIEAANAPLIENVKEENPNRIIKIGEDIEVKIYFSADFSPNDPYFVKETPDPKSLILILNLAHPFFTGNLMEGESVLTYMLMCCYDALAEWKCEFQTHQIESNTVKQIKDTYMRMGISN